MSTGSTSPRALVVTMLAAVVAAAVVLLAHPDEPRPEKDRSDDRLSQEAPGVSGAESATERPGPALVLPLRGRVVLRGEPPEPRNLRVHSAHVLMAQIDEEQGPFPDPRFEVAEDGGVPHTFVWLEMPDELVAEYGLVDTASLPPAQIVVRDVRFAPHVLGMRTGQRLEVTPWVESLMCVKYQSRRNGSANVTLPAGETMHARFDKPETAISLKCDCHWWMQAWVFVIDHPWFAVTDEHGCFEIPDLPRGAESRLKLRVWHERFASKRGRVEQEIEPTTEEVLVELGP